MVKVLQGYALIAVGTKIVVTNVTTKGDGATSNSISKQTVLATPAETKTVLDTTAIVFGTAFAATLLPLSLSILLDDLGPIAATSQLAGAGINTNECDVVDERNSIPGPNQHAMAAGTAISITGYVSKVGEGVGRSDGDRQFLFCNGRPVDSHRFNRALNEVWRKYEMKQKPAFLVALTVPAGHFDVNVTPDKREIVLASEALIIERLRAAVDALYAPSRHTFLVSSSQQQSLTQSTLTDFRVPTERTSTSASVSSFQLCVPEMVEEPSQPDKEVVQSSRTDVVSIDAADNDHNPLVLSAHCSVVDGTYSIGASQTGAGSVTRPSLAGRGSGDCADTTQGVTNSDGHSSANNNCSRGGDDKRKDSSSGFKRPAVRWIESPPPSLWAESAVAVDSHLAVSTGSVKRARKESSASVAIPYFTDVATAGAHLIASLEVMRDTTPSDPTTLSSVVISNEGGLGVSHTPRTADVFGATDTDINSIGGIVLTNSPHNNGTSSGNSSGVGSDGLQITDLTEDIDGDIDRSDSSQQHCAIHGPYRGSDGNIVSSGHSRVVAKMRFDEVEVLASNRDPAYCYGGERERTMQHYRALREKLTSLHVAAGIRPSAPFAESAAEIAQDTGSCGPALVDRETRVLTKEVL